MLSLLGSLQEPGCCSGVTSRTAGADTHIISDFLHLPLPLASQIVSRWRTLPFLSCCPLCLVTHSMSFLAVLLQAPLSNGSAPTLRGVLVPCSLLRRGPSRVNNLKAQLRKSNVYIMQQWPGTVSQWVTDDGSLFPTHCGLKAVGPAVTPVFCALLGKNKTKPPEAPL